MALAITLAFAGLAPATSSPAADSVATSGESVYKAKCVSCHGASGEGSKEYDRPLVGDKSPKQLARYIERTMPEDDPGTCVGEDAKLVAGYLHDAFYSKAARARINPPRVELARLTVRQYRNAVADVIGSFHDWGKFDGSVQGLRGQYYKSRRMRDGERVIDRVDPVLNFNFGLGGPDGSPDKFDPKEFSASWDGSVLAPETGEYEFIVRTENSIKFYLNGANQPFIDAWVKSGTETEFRGSMFLLAGQAYPLRLEYSKSKQGVNDSKEKKEKRPLEKGSIALEWKLPHRPNEVIPARYLSPKATTEKFAPSTPFPPDDRSVGYERGSSVSKEWDQATTEGALEVADYVAGHLKELAGAPAEGAERAIKVREFGLKFAERAFRRPLSATDKNKYVYRQFARDGDAETAVKRVILLVLKSPRFLYREVETLDGYDVAARLSFGLWDAPPDSALLEAAAKGWLNQPGVVLEHAWRMVDDPRSKAKLGEFFHQWLRVEHVPDLAKDHSLYPGFDPLVASDLRTSLDLFLDDVLWGEKPDYRRLFLEDSVYLNGRLAAVYGADLPADAPFTRVKIDANERAGLLTHPYLLANFAYTATSSPIHRGVFIARSVLGRALRPPPIAVSPLAPDLHAGLSTRERVTLQTSPNSCVSCHGMINPLGFGLEKFDAIGRFRSEEKGKSVDATGSYDPPSGDLVPYEGARQLAETLARSEEAHTAFVEQLFHNTIHQPIRAFGPDLSPMLRRSFAAHDFNVRSLLVEIVAASATPKSRRDPDAAFPSRPFAQER